jgi:hypothetical protein
MSDQKETELYRQLRTSQDKYTYFLLAVAASGIALSIKNTSASILSYSQIPLALAIVSWGVSFVCGCQHLRYISSLLYTNAELFDIKKGIHKKVGQNQLVIDKVIEVVMDAMESHNDNAVRMAKWQFRFIIIGALFYIAWHAVEMVLRTLNA